MRATHETSMIHLDPVMRQVAYTCLDAVLPTLEDVPRHVKVDVDAWIAEARTKIETTPMADAVPLVDAEMFLLACGAKEVIETVSEFGYEPAGLLGLEGDARIELLASVMATRGAATCLLGLVVEEAGSTGLDLSGLTTGPGNADGDPVQYLLDGLGDPDRGVSRPFTDLAAAHLVAGETEQHPDVFDDKSELVGFSYDVLTDTEHGPFLLVSTLTRNCRGSHHQAAAIVMLRAWDTSTVPEREFPLAVAENLVGVRPVTESTFPTYGPSLEGR